MRTVPTPLFVGLPAASRRLGSGALASQLIGVALLAFGLGAGVGCKIGTADVDTWKGTVKGPGKIVAVLMADKYDLSLRSHAALALLDLDRPDVDGLNELVRAIQLLQPATRERIVAQLVPHLTRTLQAPSPAATTTHDELDPAQVRAKDAAFALLQHADEDSRRQLTAAVLRWYSVDFDARGLAGNYSAEQVVRGVGAPAATILVAALNASLPPASLVKLAELIGQLGSPQAKTEAAQRLLAIEAQMRSAAFLDALKVQIAGQLGAPAKGAQAAQKNEERVEKAAKGSQERFVDEGALPALAHLATQPEVAQRLLEIASDKHASAERRGRALQALEGKVGEAQLTPLLTLALDASAPAQVQDAAFDRVGDTRSAKAIPALWPLLQNAPSPKVRGRAGELVLAIGGPSSLTEFFAKLPAGDTSYEPDELDGYAARMGQMTPLPTAVASAQLASRQWAARVIALNFFARKGNDQDIETMSPLLADATPVRGSGWEPNTTVGKVAKRAIDALQARIRQPQG